RVAGTVKDLGLPAQRLERLKTAVAEATMNAIEHGNGNRPEIPVEVEVTQDGDRSEEPTSELQSPRSTLCPYTTLFRSTTEDRGRRGDDERDRARQRQPAGDPGRGRGDPGRR